MHMKYCHNIMFSS